MAQDALKRMGDVSGLRPADSSETERRRRMHLDELVQRAMEAEPLEIGLEAEESLSYNDAYFFQGEVFDA